MLRSITPWITRAVMPCALTFLLVSCGGDTAPADGETAQAAKSQVFKLDPTVACANTQAHPSAIAVLDYIDNAVPKPLRFLIAAGTDSALPSAAEAAVQKKGPTFYWLESERNQQQIRDKLEGDGAWETMLVLVRENTDHGDGSHTLRVGGRYIGAPNDGDVSPEKRYTISCQVDSIATWTIARIDSSKTL